MDLGGALVAVGLIVAGFVLGIILRAMTARLLRRISRRLFASRGAGAATDVRQELSADIEGPATTVISAAAFWLIFLFFLAAAIETVGVPVVAVLVASVAGYLPRLVGTVFVVLVGFIAADLARTTVRSASASAGLPYGRSLARVIQLAILFVTAVVAFDQLGIETTFLIVTASLLLGAVLVGGAVAFGLGARTAVSNIIAAYYLSRSYRPGQRVRIGEHEGRIVELTATGVVLETKDGRALVPAKEFSESTSVLREEP